jgi:hypothetical protein
VRAGIQKPGSATPGTVVAGLAEAGVWPGSRSTECFGLWAAGAAEIHAGGAEIAPAARRRGDRKKPEVRSEKWVSTVHHSAATLPRLRRESPGREAYRISFGRRPTISGAAAPGSAHLHFHSQDTCGRMPQSRGWGVPPQVAARLACRDRSRKRFRDLSSLQPRCFRLSSELLTLTARGHSLLTPQSSLLTSRSDLRRPLAPLLVRPPACARKVTTRDWSILRGEDSGISLSTT